MEPLSIPVAVAGIVGVTVLRRAINAGIETASETISTAAEEVRRLWTADRWVAEDDGSSAHDEDCGLFTLHKGDDDVEVDICFVHGLTGDWKTTWAVQEKDGTAEKCWPESLLPADSRFAKARILSYGYNTTFAASAYSFRQNLNHQAQKLTQELATSRKGEKLMKRPLVFVGHSLGGLIVQGAILFSSAAKDTEQSLRSICLSTVGIVFFETPFRERSKDWADAFRDMLKLSGIQGPNSPGSLHADSSALQDNLEPFIATNRDIDVYGFVSTLISKGKNMGRSIPGYTVKWLEEKSLADMSRVTGEDDGDYSKIITVLSKICAASKEKCEEHWRRYTRGRTDARKDLNWDGNERPILLPPRNPTFLDRPVYRKLQSAIDQLNLDDNAHHSFVRLTGQRGMGKSELALEYGHDSAQKTKFTSVFWVQAETHRALMRGYVHIAKRLLDCHTARLASAEKRVQEEMRPRAAEDLGLQALLMDVAGNELVDICFKVVLEWLNHEANKGWLLILQDLYLDDTVLPLLPMTKGGQGSIIITSRQGAMIDEKVSSFSEEVSLNLIEIKVGTLEKVDVERRLCTLLGCATDTGQDSQNGKHLASSHVMVTGDGLLTFSKAVSCVVSETPSGYPAAAILDVTNLIRTTGDVKFVSTEAAGLWISKDTFRELIEPRKKLLHSLSPLACQILDCLCLVPASFITPAVFTRAATFFAELAENRPATTSDVEGEIESLVSQHLLAKDPNGSNHILLPTVIAEKVLSNCSEETEHKARRVLGRCLAAFSQEVMSEKESAALYLEERPLSLLVISYLAGMTWRQVETDVQSYRLRPGDWICLAEFCLRRGHFPEAQYMSDLAAHQLDEELEPVSAATEELYFRLVQAYVDIATNATSSSSSSSARDSSLSPKLSRARAISQAQSCWRKIQRRVSFPDTAEWARVTTATKRQIRRQRILGVRLLRLRGETDRAVEDGYRLLRYLEDSKGPVDNLTLVALRDLVDLLASSSGGVPVSSSLDADQTPVIPLIRRLLISYESVYGVDHPLAAEATMLLGAAAARAGDYDEAETQLARARDGHRRRQGAHHPLAQLACTKMAAVRGLQERHGEAGRLLADALDVLQAAYGPYHRETLMTRYNLATSYLEQGDAAKAEDTYAEVVSKLEDLRGGYTLNEELGRDLELARSQLTEAREQLERIREKTEDD